MKTNLLYIGIVSVLFMGSPTTSEARILRPNKALKPMVESGKTLDPARRQLLQQQPNRQNRFVVETQKSIKPEEARKIANDLLKGTDVALQDALVQVMTRHPEIAQSVKKLAVNKENVKKEDMETMLQFVASTASLLSRHPKNDNNPVNENIVLDLAKHSGDVLSSSWTPYERASFLDLAKKYNAHMMTTGAGVGFSFKAALHDRNFVTDVAKIKRKKVIREHCR